MTQAEVVSGNAPAAADSWTDVGTFTVPANVKRIKKVRMSVAPDYAIDTSIRICPAFRLIGSGLLEQSPHEYLGPSGGGAAVTVGSATFQKLVVEYETDIPVQSGGTFTCQVNFLDEVIAAGAIDFNVFYDNEAPKAKNSMSQYADAASGATADVWATVGTLVIPRPGAGKDPTMIKQVAVALGLDQGVAAVLLRHSLRIRLTGAGLAEGGTHEFIATAGGTWEETDGYVTFSLNTEKIDIDIPVSAGGSVLIEAMLDDEVPTAGTIAVCLHYA